MLALEKKNWPLGILPAAAVILAAIVLLLAPEEQTLGEGIKIVYVHVAFIWTGMVGLIAAGLLGLFVSVSARRQVEAWNRVLGGVALGAFAIGLLLSGPAASMNWGGVFWREPRTLAALQVLAMGMIVQVLILWPLPLRLKGLLHAALVGFMVWSIQSTPLVLHPDDPARASGSLAIRATFFILFALTSLVAGWLVVIWRRHIRPHPTQVSD
ncbi:MAG: hypothetical protein R3300_21545 [Candidatus Promineifilaceae bacterium]|nr:hypothetical protein [Candidatus Promineifilaceae bacterium]